MATSLFPIFRCLALINARNSRKRRRASLVFPGLFVFHARRSFNELLLAVLVPLQGLSVASVALFGSLDTTEPAVAELSEQMADTLSLGGHSTEGSTYAPPVRQGPGGNSSLVLG